MRSDLNFDDNANTDALFIEINRNQESNVIVGVVYRAPDQNLHTFYAILWVIST